jgi:hypothetical protein
MRCVTRSGQLIIFLTDPMPLAPHNPLVGRRSGADYLSLIPRQIDSKSTSILATSSLPRAGSRPRLIKVAISIGSEADPILASSPFTAPPHPSSPFFFFRIPDLSEMT